MIFFIIKLMFTMTFITSGIFLACITNRYECNDSHDKIAKTTMYLTALFYMVIGLTIIL